VHVGDDDRRVERVLGAALTIPNAELLLGACVVPPLVMLFVWRNAPPVALTVAR